MFKWKITTKQKTLARETVETLGTAILLALIIRSFLIQPFKIPTGSMEPTLMPGDRILVVRYLYGFRIPFTFKRVFKFKSPQTGDIVVFNAPEDIKRPFIKRCIATSGDTVEIRNGSVVLNGTAIHKPPINSIYYYNCGDECAYGKEGMVLKIPTNNYFALGDNSANSKDSRFWGFLDDKYLIGRAVMVYWPPNRIRFLK
ncbi:MAG: signal peptidase I [Candidatus Omnitrophota bacterium]